MASNPESLYVDSCCFIDAVKKDVGLLPPEREADVWHLKQLMRAHFDDAIRLNTSMLALAECVAVESGQTDVPQSVQENFRKLLTSGQYVRLITPTPKTGKMMQDLRWVHKVVLGGPDAVHIATALEAGCSEYLSSDERLKKQKMKDAAPTLASIKLRLITPKQTMHLPMQYLQTSVFDAQGSDKGH